eukprot:3260491-Pyramimonas_sp.AAC.1
MKGHKPRRSSSMWNDARAFGCAGAGVFKERCWLQWFSRAVVSAAAQMLRARRSTRIVNVLVL